MPIAAAGIGAVVYAFGPRTILYRAIFHLPAGNWFRGPDRALIVFGFAIAVLCGAGIDAVLSDGIGAVGPDHRRRLTMLVVPAAAVALIAVLNLSLAQHAAAALATVYGVAGIAMLCVIAVSDARPVGRTAAIVALGALVLFDLGHAQPHEGVLPSRLGPYFTRLEPIFAEIRRRQGFARTYIWATFERADPLYFLSDIAKAGLNHGIWMATDYEPLDGHVRIKADDKWIETQTLIVASGASSRWLGLENEEKLVGHGLTSCATCDGAFYRNVPVCVIGGGDSAAEEALFLTRFASKVYLIHRRDKLRASKIMADRVLACETIEPIWNTVVTRYVPDEKGEMSAVMLRDVTTHEERELFVACVFVAIGHDPNTKAFQGKLETDPDGYLIVRHLAESMHPGVFIAGDVADRVYKQAVTAAGSGCAAAIEAERYLSALEKSAIP